MQIKSALKNSFFALLGQIALIVVGFFCQRTMNLYLGAELIGMNGVIANIIAILSVSELGISTAVVYHLYAAFSTEDEEEIAGLMNLYRKAYLCFAAVILLLGLAVMPFVPFFLKNTTFSFGYIRLIFGLWLVRTAFSYLLSYKRSILIADQREYVVSIVTLIVNVVNYSSTIVFVMVSRNYAAALFFNIVVEAVSNLWISWYVDQKYPFLRKLRRQPLHRDTVKKVIDNIKDIFVTKLFSKLLISTDNLIISGFIGTVITGLYNNYCLVTQSLNSVLIALAGAVKPTLGYLFLEQDKRKDVMALREITFLFFYLISTASVCVFCLINPFIGDLWLNENFLMDRFFVAILVMQFYWIAIGLPVEAVMGVTGLFDKERNISAVVAIVNLVVSLLLVNRFGIIGVMLGTITAYMVQIGYRTYVFFDQYIGESCRLYLLDLIQYSVVTVAETFLTYSLVERVYTTYSFFRFLAVMAISAVVPLTVNTLLYGRTQRARSVILLLRQVRGSQKETEREQCVREDVEQDLICALLRASLAESGLDGEERENLANCDRDRLLDLAQRHKVLPLLWDILMEDGQLSDRQKSRMEQICEPVVSSSYRLLFLTRFLVGKIREAGFDVVVLKGCGVASYYPVPEYRKSGDIDLLVREEDCQNIRKLLHEEGYFVKDAQHANHHISCCSAEGIDIELHIMLSEPFRNKKTNEFMEACAKEILDHPDWVNVMGVLLPVPGESLQALHLLLHMLQHFLRSGFGLKMLADWVVFWNRDLPGQVRTDFMELAQKCGIADFEAAVTQLCETRLGMRTLPKSVRHVDEKLTDELLVDVMAGGEFGKDSTDRMVIVHGTSMHAYFQEFHYQMKLNHPRTSGCVLLWPVLWVITLVVFLANNRKLHRGSAREILRNAGKRGRLVRRMGLWGEERED